MLHHLYYLYSQIKEGAPVAPVIKLRLSSAWGDEQTLEAKAVLDTGASITVIPQSLLEKINAPITGMAGVLNVTGGIMKLINYAVKIELIDHPNLSICTVVVGIPSEPSVKGQEFIILGRDVLNKFKIIFDGPNQQFDIQYIQ